MKATQLQAMNVHRMRRAAKSWRDADLQQPASPQRRALPGAVSGVESAHVAQKRVLGLDERERRNHRGYRDRTGSTSSQCNRDRAPDALLDLSLALSVSPRQPLTCAQPVHARPDRDGVRNSHRRRLRHIGGPLPWRARHAGAVRPTKDRRRRATLNSCGNSSSDVLRMNRPTRVTRRKSLRVTSLGGCFASVLSAYIEQGAL